MFVIGTASAQLTYKHPRHNQVTSHPKPPWLLTPAFDKLQDIFDISQAELIHCHVETMISLNLCLTYNQQARATLLCPTTCQAAGEVP
jgi:hypothetical protein